MDKNICGTTASWIVYTNKSFSAWIQWKYWDDWMNRVPNGATWQEINLEHPYCGCLRGDGTIPFPFEVSSINPIEVETGQSEQSVEATFKEKQETTLSIVTGEGAHPIYKHYRCKKGAIQHITRYRWRCRCYCHKVQWAVCEWCQHKHFYLNQTLTRLTFELFHIKTHCWHNVWILKQVIQ